MDRRIDVALALGVTALGIFIIVFAQSIGRSPVPDPIGPRGIPTGLGTAFVLGGIALVARRVVRWRREGTYVEHEGSQDDVGVPPGSARRALTIWLAAAMYVVLLPVVGYLIATPLFVAATLRLLQFKRRPLLRVPAIVAYPILYTVISYAVFATLLGIRLPVGPLRDVFLTLTGR
jgi:hypothetical protein